MINFDDIANESKIEHNPNHLYIPNDPYRIPITGVSRSRKTRALLNQIRHQRDIDKIYLYAKDLHESKNQLLISKRKKLGIDHYSNPKACTEYSNDIQDIYKIVDDYNHTKNAKRLITFDNMIADMISNKKLNPIVTELFIRVIKLDILLVFIN